MSREHERSGGSHDSEKSVKKKIETLLRCTKKLEHEISALKHVRHGERGAAGETKADFIRAAAALRCTIDEHGAALQQVRAENERDLPALEALRLKLYEANAANRERRAMLQSKSDAQVAAVREQQQVWATWGARMN